MKILAIDPGHTTGIAYKDFSEDADFFTPPFTMMPVGFDTCAYEIACLFENVSAWPDLVICEKFQITGLTARKTTGGSNEAIELIGVARYLTKKWNIPFEEQRPADAMSFVTDDKLKRIGWYKPGLDHARDAMRHLLLAACRYDKVDLTKLLPST